MKLTREVSINSVPVIGYAYEVPTNLSQAIQLVQQERDFRRRAGGYKVGDKWYHSDIESKIEQMALKSMGLAIPPGLKWKTMDGTKVTMTASLADNIFDAGVVKSVMLFEAGETHIANLENVVDFTGYNYFTGWPQCYWESQ